MMEKVKLWLKIGLVLVVGLVFASYKLGQKQVRLGSQPVPTSTPPPIIEWKTYTDSEYGYELKYPSNWEVFHPEENSGIWGITLRSATGQSIGEIIVSAGNKQKITLPIEKWIVQTNKEHEEAVKKGVRGSTGVGLIIIEESKNVAIGGEKAIVTSQGAGMDETVTYYLVHNNKIFTISTDFIYGPADDETVMVKNSYQQILSTFRFLD